MSWGITTMKLNRPMAVIGPCFFLIVGFSNQVSAFNSANLQWLKQKNECRGCDLSRADLSQISLKEADLPRANLTDANLSNTDLTGANLTEANLSGANLTKAKLIGANLSGSVLPRSSFDSADLAYANLSGSDLVDSSFRHVMAAFVDLSNSNLTRASFENSMLFGLSSFNNSNLTEVSFRDALVATPDFSGAILCRTIMPDGKRNDSGCPYLVRKYNDGELPKSIRQTLTEIKRWVAREVRRRNLNR